MGAERLVIAVDLGGTKAAAALLTDEGRILYREQETTAQEGPVEGIAQVARLARRVTAQAGASIRDVWCMGVGIPAVLEAGTDRVIWAPKLNGWRNVDLRPALQAELGVPVYVEYDGHTAVLGEWWQGSGRGYHSLVALIIGTGVGGGMILDGRLYRGFNRLAGAAGWFALTTEAELQDERAKAIGFWDALASGPGLALYAQSLLKDQPESSLGCIARRGELTAEEVFKAAQQGDPQAVQILDQFAGWLGLGIANIVSLLNPQAVILCGGVGSHCQPLLPRISRVVERWAQPIAARAVEIQISQLGGDAGLYGAAWGALLRWGEDPDLQVRILRGLQRDWGGYVEGFKTLEPEAQAAFLVRQGYRRFADLLTHVSAWWKEGLQGVMSLLEDRGFTAPQYDVDSFNAQAVEKSQDWSEQEVIQAFEAQRNELVEFVRKLPAEAFENERIVRRLSIEVVGHYDEHKVI
jgi:glucokinase